MGKQRFLGAKAQSVIQFGSNTLVDEETITILGKVYEFDDDDAVIAGHVKVTIGGTAALSAAALLAAINANKPTPGVTASLDPLDNTKVRLTADARGTAGNGAVTETVADAGVTVHDLIGGEAGATQTESRGAYTVLQDDIDGVKSIEVDSSLTSPRFCIYQVLRAGVALAYDGAFTISSSKLRWAQAGSTDMAAGDIITWHAWE